MEIVVDLPAPLGPRKPNVSPASTRKEMPFTASISPKLFGEVLDVDDGPARRNPSGSHGTQALPNSIAAPALAAESPDPAEDCSTAISMATR